MNNDLPLDWCLQWGCAFETQPDGSRRCSRPTCGMVAPARPKPQPKPESGS